MKKASPRHSITALPVRASLEHLRNEAKSLLRDLRRTERDARLTTAQLAVARRYGFAGWRQLKAYVDALHSEGARLVAAVRTGDLATISAVLDRHPALANMPVDLAAHVVRPSDTPAMRLMHIAVAEDQPEAAKLLIARGADLNVRNIDGRTALHDCFELGRDAFAQLLLGAGSELDACLAAGYGYHATLREILARDPTQANDLRTGLSPLGWSAYGDQPESAEILFEHGALVNRPPFDVQAWGATAHVANLGLARVMLDRGADPNCRHQGRYLNAAGRAEGDTPLHTAIKSRIVVDPTEFVAMLLSKGADPTARNGEGRTPLDEALLQIGKRAETYYPVRPIAAKSLERVITMLKEAASRAPS
jgi:ankyrin repeat protein